MVGDDTALTQCLLRHHRRLCRSFTNLTMVLASWMSILRQHAVGNFLYDCLAETI